MTAPTERQARRTPARSCALLPTLVFCLLPLGMALPAAADTPQNSKNTIVSIRTTFTIGGPTTYDITLNSSAEFPMDDAVITLNIGGKEFINSRYAGGTLNTLDFRLTPSQFQSLKNGDPVVIYDGEHNAAIPEAQWKFGTLNLSMLDQGTTITLPTRPVTITGAPVRIVGSPVTTVGSPVTLVMRAAARTMTAMTAKTMTAETEMLSAQIARKGQK